MRKQNIALTAWLLGTLGALVALIVGMNYALNQPRLMDDAPRIGAGANDTGGVNAIGELLAGNKANHGIKEVREREEAGKKATEHAGEVPAADAESKGVHDHAAPVASPHAGGAMGLLNDAAANESAASEQAASADGKVNPATLEQGFILLVEDKARRASASDPIYFASNVTGWNPGDEAFKMTAQSDMRWRIHLKKPVPKTNPNEPIEFKFARGDWKKCEVASDMSDLGNRKLPMIDASAIKGNEPPVIELKIEHWADERDGADTTVGDFRSIKVSAGTLKRLQVRGGAAGARATTRDLLVWLPPGYDDAANANRTYPVLYLHDGQNLFEKHAGIPGEWGVDETCARLIAEKKIEPLIVVGVPHSGSTRVQEYMPPVPGLGEPAENTSNVTRLLYHGKGDEHVAWLLSEVMPRVQGAFRVKTGPENTGVGGSSMGGLISLYAGSTHSEVFGKVLAESPSLRLRAIDARPVFQNVKRWPARVYLGVGGREMGQDTQDSREYADAVRGLEKTLSGEHSSQTKTQLSFEVEAVHDENAWAKRLGGALEFLFPAK